MEEEVHAAVHDVIEEFPVLGEPSLEAHRISLAVIQKYPEIYDAYHRALLNDPGRKDGQKALDVAMSMGADGETVKKAASDPSINAAIQEVYQLADGLGITGTLSYVIGDEVVFGAVGYDRIMPKVQALRECGKATC